MSEIAPVYDLEAYRQRKRRGITRDPDPEPPAGRQPVTAPVVIHLNSAA